MTAPKLPRGPGGGLARLAVVAALWASCAGPDARVVAARPPEPGAPVVLERHYELRFFGALVGAAHELERRDGDAVTLERRELVLARRGQRGLALTTAVTVRGRAQADHVEVETVRCEYQPLGGGARADAAPCAPGSGERYAGRAVREADGWRVIDDAGQRRLPAAATPAEWSALAVPPASKMAVFFPGARFALGEATVRVVSATSWTARIAVGAAPSEVTTVLGSDQRAELVLGSDGLVAERVAAPARSWPLADLVDETALRIEGQPPSGGAEATLTVTLARAAAAPPPVLGQSVRAVGARWHVALHAEPFGEDGRRIAELAQAVALQEPARTRGAPGDCTAYALRFLEVARQRGVAARLVTGLVVDGDRLLRHRWAQAHTGARWLTVDPSTGEAPPTARRVALWVHDGSVEALAAAPNMYAPLVGAQVRWGHADERDGR